MFLDGKPLGMSPVTDVEAYEGMHRVRILNRDLDARRVVKTRVMPGKVTSIVEDLTVETSAPEEGKPVGVTEE